MNLEIDNIENLQEIDEAISKLETKRNQFLKKNGFPYIDIFTMSTNAGEEVEKLLSDNVFFDLERVKGRNHDHLTSNKKDLIETKAIRMMVKGSETYTKRAVSITDEFKGYIKNKKIYGGNISTTTLQQIKNYEFTYLIGVILFKDGMDIYLIPSTKISNPKIKKDGMAYLSGQHKGNDREGQLNYNDSVLSKHYVLSIYNNGDQLYYYDRETKKIGDIFNKLSIEKIINEKFGF